MLCQPVARTGHFLFCLWRPIFARPLYRREQRSPCACFISVNAGGPPPLTNIAAIDTPLASHPAVAQQMGSVWGLAFNPQTQTLYAAAFMKRHSGFGPNGPGAIYQLPKGGTPSLFYNAGATMSIDPHPQANQTCLSPGHNANNTNANCWLNDTNSFNAVGKTGFGDLDISDDFKTLYTINLRERKPCWQSRLPILRQLSRSCSASSFLRGQRPTSVWPEASTMGWSMWAWSVRQSPA